MPLIDSLPGTVEDRLATLASCGLSEARLLLRTPFELSEGQRYRFRLALGLAQLGARNSERGAENQEVSSVPSSAFHVPRFLVADEFTATLDRALAKVIAFNVRKLVSRTGVGVLAATTHEDIVEDLQPDLWVRA